jgi:hypothetical protein
LTRKGKIKGAEEEERHLGSLTPPPPPKKKALEHKSLEQKLYLQNAPTVPFKLHMKMKIHGEWKRNEKS